jgi:hypothetical protein
MDTILADRNTFIMPATLAEAEAARLQLINDIESIQTQLTGQREKLAEGLIDNGAFREWKFRATFALVHKKDQLRKVKSFITTNKSANSVPAMPKAAMIRALYELGIELAQDVPLNAEQSVVLIEARTFLESIGMGIDGE